MTQGIGRWKQQSPAPLLKAHHLVCLRAGGSVAVWPDTPERAAAVGI